MKSFYILIAGASLFSMLSAHTEPIQTHESPSFSSFSDEACPLSSSFIDEDLSLFDEEIDEFEDEILALEEELKRDAESFRDIDKKESVALQAIAERQAVFDQMEVESMVLETPTEPLSENLIFDVQELVAPLVPVDTVEANPDFALVQPLEQETPPLAKKELLQTNAPTIPLTSDTSSSEAFSSKDEEVAFLEKAPKTQEGSPLLNVDASSMAKKNEMIEVNIQQAFSGSPIIYTILGAMSVFALCVWLYNILSLRKSVTTSPTFLKNVKNSLNSNHFDNALSLCQHHENLISKMIASGINSRRHGLPIMIEAMKSEGKRASIHFWQRIGLLNDIAIIAPMLGLLGTVLGMFYAFYDINRSIESISTLFDGLGVSVGTTVAGLIVAILALILHSIAKYRLVKVLATVENEAQSLATLIDDRSDEYKG